MEVLYADKETDTKKYIKNYYRKKKQMEFNKTNNITPLK